MIASSEDLNDIEKCWKLITSEMLLLSNSTKEHPRSFILDQILAKINQVQSPKGDIAATEFKAPADTIASK
jgi:hypothetical protein